MTPDEWLDAASDTMMKEHHAGNSINRAASEAMDSLIGGWEESVIEDRISCRVVLHDLLEVAQRLRDIHDELKAKLPGVLDELAR